MAQTPRHPEIQNRQGIVLTAKKHTTFIHFVCLQNIASFLADAEKLKESRTQVPPFSPTPSTSGGLKLPPFEARERDESNPNEAPKAFLEEEETRTAKQYLYAQMDSFDRSVFLWLHARLAPHR